MAATTSRKGPPKYAAGTNVPVEKSHIAVQKLLKQHGATNTGYGEQGDKASILFTVRGRQYRIELTYPHLSEFLMAGRIKRTQAQAEAAREQEIRRLWRALFMVVKAKLEAAQSGFVTFEQEFFAHTVLANNQTVSEWVEAQVSAGKVPLLPEMSSARQEEIPDIVLDGDWTE